MKYRIILSVVFLILMLFVLEIKTDDAVSEGGETTIEETTNNPDGPVPAPAPDADKAANPNFNL